MFPKLAEKWLDCTLEIGRCICKSGKYSFRCDDTERGHNAACRLRLLLKGKLPILRNKVQARKARALSEIIDFRVQVRHGPRFLDSGSIDGAQVNSHAELCLGSQFGNEERSCLPFGGGHVNKKMQFFQPFNIFMQEFSLLWRLPSAVNLDWFSPRLESDLHWWHVGWLGFTQPCSKTDLYSCRSFSRRLWPVSLIPWVFASNSILFNAVSSSSRVSSPRSTYTSLSSRASYSYPP